MRITVPVIILFCLILCPAGLATEDPPEETFPVTLTGPNGPVTIQIPDGRPIYALLVSGYHQNAKFDMFHWYNFANCVRAQGGYVHYAWWNNLLAPYMKEPLHDSSSQPGLAEILDGTALGFLPIVDYLDIIPDKAIPGEDFQFQADAKELLRAIREHNPQAAIVIAGHSMGGDAVARLGASIDIDIDLLAPIDPVGNRSCTQWSPGSPVFQCSGLIQWTRLRATHEDYFFWPDRREFGSNIKYLYHRWQQEFLPPMDFACPPGGNMWVWCVSVYGYNDYLFGHPDIPPVKDIYQGSTNVQSQVPTSYSSYPDLTGRVDGHGEIVGFRGFDAGALESRPLALAAQNWPADQASRVALMQAWDRDANYLDNNDHAPVDPDLCMVSGDLCEILRTAVNLVPKADAGPDQVVECSGPDGAPVPLDGSASRDPNDDPLSYTWTGPFGTWTGEIIEPVLPLGSHSITLTVEDGRGKTDSDTVEITVRDSTPPSMGVYLTPSILWPPNHKLKTIQAWIQVTDVCDDSPGVELVSIVSNEPGNGSGSGNANNDIQGADMGTDDRTFQLRAKRAGSSPGRIYTVTYEAYDGFGNVNDSVSMVLVTHDNRRSDSFAKPSQRSKRGMSRGER